MTRGLQPINPTRKAASSATLLEVMTSAGNQVLIAGGGIAGLSVALSLARQGIASEILERETDLTDAGAGIQLGPNAVRILQAMGAAEMLRPLAVTPSHLVVHDGENGKTLARLPFGPEIAKRHGAPYWTVHRADLHNALVETARAQPLITLTTGFGVAAVAQDATSVRLTSSDGTERQGAFALGADGRFSVIRKLLFGGGDAPSSAYVAYRSVVSARDMPPAFRSNAVHLWLAPNLHVVHYPVRAEREHALVVVSNEGAPRDGWNVEADAQHVQSLAGQLQGGVSAVIAAAQSWRKWALSDPAPLSSWVSGRVALLGDAAHPILPFLAQGGALALEDAETLAHNLARIAAANGAPDFAHYERQRQARAQRVQRAARRNGQTYHLSGLPARARNLVLRAMPPERLLASYDWLYGWRSPTDA